MDKLIKSISKSGSFRAYVLDSTETVRTAQEKHQTLPSSTVALGRTLIANQILAANQKGDSKVTVKVIGDSSLGHIISVADTKGHVKGYIQNKGVDIKKTATGEVVVGPFMGAGQFVVITDYGTGNPYTSSTPLVSGEIGEDLAFYLTESEQTPSAVGLNVLLNDEAKVLSEEEISFSCDCSRERFEAALATLGKDELQAMRDEDHSAEITCQFCGKTYTFSEEDLEGLIND